MTIKEFCNAYKAKNFMNTKQGVDERNEWIKNELSAKEYVPFDEKQAIAQTVLVSCSSIRDGVVSIDSIRKYMLFTMAMLSTYTNLESDEDTSLSDEYDVLCSCKVGDVTMLDAIIKTFEIEYSRCNDILNMMTADLLAENNIENVTEYSEKKLKEITEVKEKLTNNNSKTPFPFAYFWNGLSI